MELKQILHSPDTYSVQTGILPEGSGLLTTAGLFWISPYAGPAVVVLLAAGGACYIAGAIVYALRKPDPWPKVFGFHEIFHCGTVAGYACHMVAIYMVIVQLWP